MFPFLKKQDEPVVIRFMFQSDRMRWKDLKTVNKLQGGTVNAEELQLLAARFMVDKNSEYLPEAKAIEILDDLSGPDIQDVLQKFTAAIAEAASPKASGSASSLPSEAGQAGTLPAGPQP